MDEEELLRLSKEFIRTGDPSLALKLNECYIPHFLDSSCGMQIAPFRDTFVMVEIFPPREVNVLGNRIACLCKICEEEIKKEDQWINSGPYHLRCVKEPPKPTGRCTTCVGAYLKNIYDIKMGVNIGIPEDIFWQDYQSYRLVQRLYLECTKYDLWEEYDRNLNGSNLELDRIQGKIKETVREHLPKELTYLVMRFLLLDFALIND